MKKLRRIIALILTLTIMSSVAAVGSTNVFAADVEESSVGEVTFLSEKFSTTAVPACLY